MLYGRDAERSRIGALLDGARASRSAALVITGEPGVGKSAVLEDALERAGDMRVLRGAGVETEAHLPFAALHQIVRPVLGHVDDLPQPQGTALRGALGLAAGTGDDRFLVSLAVLTLLAEAAEQRPLLCLVDDAHWLDDASADALVFVARRLEAEGIVMLFAAREGEARRFEAAGLPELQLSGLDPAAAGTLIDRATRVALSAELRDRLLVETGGNPLALLELSSALSEDQLSGAEPVLAPLPVSARVERAFLARVDALPDETRTLLLVAAADDTGELATVLRAAAHLGTPTGALDAAEQAGLAQVRGTRFEFRHPLVRSAVYHAAPLSARQAAHNALASALDGDAEADRRAWHRAAASVEPDPSVGEELEQAAQRARRRSGFAAASLAFERAAALTADEEHRARRLTAAAENAWLAGRVERAVVLLERTRPLVSQPVQRADIDRFLGLIEMTRGVPADACRLLLRAAAEVAPSDGERALQLLNIAGLAAAYAGDRDAAVAIAELAGSLPAGGTPFDRMLVELLVGLGAHAEGRFADAAPMLRSAIELAEVLDGDAAGDEPIALLFAGRAALYLGDDRAAFETHREAAARARASGALSIVTQILPRLAITELWAGRWPAASANATEGVQLARELGHHDLVAQQLAVLALVAALRGSEDECRALVAESRELAVARRLGIVVELADWALALLELGLGRADEALARCRDVSSTLVVFWGGLDRSRDPLGRSGDRAHLAGGARAVGGERRGCLGTRGLQALPRTPLRRRPGGRTSLLGGARRARRGRPSVRACTQRARLRRVPSPRATPRRGARPPAGGARRLRPARGDALGGARASRAAGDRPDGAKTRPEHDRRAHCSGASDRPLRRRGTHEPGGRRTALPEPAHDRLPPPERLQKGRRQLSHGAGPPRSRLRDHARAARRRPGDPAGASLGRGDVETTTRRASGTAFIGRRTGRGLGRATVSCVVESAPPHAIDCHVRAVA